MGNILKCIKVKATIHLPAVRINVKIACAVVTIRLNAPTGPNMYTVHLAPLYLKIPNYRPNQYSKQALRTTQPLTEITREEVAESEESLHPPVVIQRPQTQQAASKKSCRINFKSLSTSTNS